MARLLVGLLDEWLPIVRGGELNDDPYAPVSPAARAIVERDGDATPIDWLPRDRRYAEKLATPDITIADLIGEVDPIKVAEGRYLSDELTLHYGLIPRANRGIVAINELPDLAERIQVGLLNVLEERDVQIRGFTVRLPLDLFVVASREPGGLHVARPDHHARSRTDSARRSGRTTRARSSTRCRSCARRSSASPAAICTDRRRARVHGGARRRADPPRSPIAGDQPALGRVGPRVGRQHGGARGRRAQAGDPLGRVARGAARLRPRARVVASTVGKVELESVGDEAPEERIVERLITKALYATFTRRVSIDDLDPVVEAFEDGFTVETGERTPSREYVAWAREVPGLDDAVRGLGTFDVTDGAEEPAVIASAVEFLLEGLHLARRINKEQVPGGVVYRR